MIKNNKRNNSLNKNIYDYFMNYLINNQLKMKQKDMARKILIKYFSKKMMQDYLDKNFLLSLLKIFNFP